MKKRIQVNQLGYMTGMPKNAVCRVTAGVFYLVEAATGISVYAGRLTCPFFDRESGDNVRLADFSDFNTCGSYFIRAGYRRSDVFEISAEPYRNIRRIVLDGIFTNRCGCDLSAYGERCGSYAHKECHTDPVMRNGIAADVSGGWHTGGKYEKDLRSACLTVADMIYSVKLFGENFSVNERENITDECRWGLEWILRMQDRDGGVYGGISGGDGETVIPEEDGGEYSFKPQSCSAALIFTAAAALGSVFFEKTDKAFSRKLKQAAELSWIAALRTDEYENYCRRLGSTSENGDGLNAIESEFMWAMCEMYALTGEKSFEQMINEKYMLSSFHGFGYSACGGFAALSYLMNSRTHDRTAEAFIRKRLTDRADRMLIAVNSSGYRTARSADGGYTYGSNFAVLSDCMDFIAAYLISGEQKYLEGAFDQFGYIFGKNPMGVSYVTGCGNECCQMPFHVMSMAMDNDAPVRGMAVSGANYERSDEYSKWHIEKGTPAAKCYADCECSTSTNEPSVHFSAPIIFVSSFFDRVGKGALTGI